MINFVVEDGTGLSNANSYVSIDDFKQYWIDRGVEHSVSDDKIKSILIQATQYVDKSFNYIGTRPSLTQSLNWPRWYAYSKDGHVFSGVPNEVIYATCEAGALALDGAVLFGSTEDGISEKTENVGPIQTTYKYVSQQTGRVAYQSVLIYLKDLIKTRTNKIRRY